eukprot:720132_1
MERRQHHQNQVQSHKQQSQNQIHTQYHRDNLHSTKQIQLQPQSYGQSHQHHQNQVQSHKQQSQNQIHTQYHRDNLHSTKQIQLQPQSYGQSHQHARYNSIPHIYHSNPSPQQTIYMNYHSQQQRQTNNNYNMLQYNNIINKNTGLSLDAQIRAHHNDMDSDEG